MTGREKQALLADIVRILDIEPPRREDEFTVADVMAETDSSYSTARRALYRAVEDGTMTSRKVVMNGKQFRVWRIVDGE